MTLVVVLNGGAVFAADLMRQLTISVTVGFIRAQSYGQATRSSGRVRVSGLAGLDLAGRHAILVDDIVDSGLTARTLLARLKSRNPASLALCALLHKPNGAEKPALLRYTGFTIADRFVVGYGMDHAGQYRGLPGIYALPDQPG